MGAMSGGGRYPRWRVLVDGDLVAGDRDGAIASVVSGLGGFPLSPELLLDHDGSLGLEVREWSPWMMEGVVARCLTQLTEAVAG